MASELAGRIALSRELIWSGRTFEAEALLDAAPPAVPEASPSTVSPLWAALTCRLSFLSSESKAIRATLSELPSDFEVCLRALYRAEGDAESSLAGATGRGMLRWAKKPEGAEAQLAAATYAIVLADARVLLAQILLRSGSLIKGGFYMRKAHQGYELARSLLEQVTALAPGTAPATAAAFRTLLEEVRSAVAFGRGAFLFCISLCPPKFLWVVSALGFEADQVGGKALVVAAAASKGSRAAHAFHLLLWMEIFYFEHEAAAAHVLHASALAVPRCATLLLLSAYMHREAGRVEQALAVVVEAQAQVGGVDQMRLNLEYEAGWCLLLLGDLVGARAKLELFLRESRSKSFRAYAAYQLGIALDLLGDPAAASRVLATIPGYVRKNFSFDELAARKGLEYVAAGGSWRPGEALCVKASLLTEAKRFAEALDLLSPRASDAVYSRPGDERGQFYYHLGLAHGGLGHRAEAERCFGEVVAMARSYKCETWLPPYALFALGELLRAAGDAAAARAKFEAALKEHSGYDLDKPLIRKLQARLSKGTFDRTRENPSMSLPLPTSQAERPAERPSADGRGSAQQIPAPELGQSSSFDRSTDHDDIDGSDDDSFVSAESGESEDFAASRAQSLGPPALRAAPQASAVPQQRQHQHRQTSQAKQQHHSSSTATTPKEGETGGSAHRSHRHHRRKLPASLSSLQLSAASPGSANLEEMIPPMPDDETITPAARADMVRAIDDIIDDWVESPSGLVPRGWGPDVALKCPSAPVAPPFALKHLTAKISVTLGCGAEVASVVALWMIAHGRLVPWPVPASAPVSAAPFLAQDGSRRPNPDSLYVLREWLSSSTLSTVVPFTLPPRPAVEVSVSLMSRVQALMDSNFGADGVPRYHEIASSPGFRRFVLAASELAQVDLAALTYDQSLVFYLNVYNTLMFAGLVLKGAPVTLLKRRSFFGSGTILRYKISRYVLTIDDIEHGVLRGNRRKPYSLSRPFASGDPRLALVVSPFDPRVHFALNCGVRVSTIRFITAEDPQQSLAWIAEEFVRQEVAVRPGGVVSLPQIFSFYEGDFGGSTDRLLRFLLPFLEPAAAHRLNALLVAHTYKVVYTKHRWDSWYRVSSKGLSRGEDRSETSKSESEVEGEDFK